MKKIFYLVRDSDLAPVLLGIGVIIVLLVLASGVFHKTKPELKMTAMESFVVGNLKIDYTVITSKTDPEIYPETKKALHNTMEQVSLVVGRAMAADEAHGWTLNLDLVRAVILGNKDDENLILQMMEDMDKKKTGGLSGPEKGD